MEFKNVSLNEIDKVIQKSEKPVVCVFFGTWCPFCQKAIPEIISHFGNLTTNYDIHLISVEETDDVWAEDNNTKWALNVVPTFRIYKQGKIVWQHEKEIKPKKFENIIKSHL